MCQSTNQWNDFMYELDTGASVSLASERVWREKLNAVPLNPSSLGLRTYTGKPLELLGQAQVHVVYEGQSATLPMLVVSGDGPSLFGRNWLSAIRFNWGEIKKVYCTLDNLMEQYAEIFKDELGTIHDYTMKLMLKEKAKPKFSGLGQSHMPSKEPLRKTLTGWKSWVL